MLICRHRTSSIAAGVLAATLICAHAGAFAQSVYRHVAADGHITYSDRPAPDAAEKEDTAPPSAVATALAGNTVISSRLATAVDAKEAARRLRQAQLERRQGEQLLPGETLQGPGDGAHHNRYGRRQDRLRIAVEQAQRRSNETRR